MSTGKRNSWRLSWYRLAFPEEDNGSLKKIPKLEDPAQYSRLGLVVYAFLFSYRVDKSSFIRNSLTFPALLETCSLEELIWT